MDRLKLVVVLCVVALVALAGCGSSDDEGDAGGGGSSSGRTVAIDVGLDRPIEVDTDKPRIAFIGTSGNLLLQSQIKGVEEQAEKRGLELTVLDSKFDPTVQLRQVQNALQQDRFDAFIVVPLDSEALCPVLTRQAVEAGVPVVTNNVPLCGKVSEPEDESLWSPGTVAHVGSVATVDANRSFHREVARRRGP